MPVHSESEGRNRWRTARERERMRARREIRTRVLTAGVSDDEDGGKERAGDENEVERPCRTSIAACLSETTSPLPSPELELDALCTLLRQVEAGRSSAFSVSTLSKYHEVLNKPLPTTLLSSYKIETLCTSRFGAEYAQSILAYAEALESCTIIEYATWLGEYKLLGPLLAGGLDPTLRGQFKSVLTGGEPSMKHRSDLSTRVLQRFFDAFPSSLSSYIVKRVVDMRLQHWKDHYNSDCALCGSLDPAQLWFGLPCNHSFCENCFWQDLLDHVDDRDDGDVVLCPVCGKAGCDTDNSCSISDECYSSSDLRCKSLEKYLSLPATSKELKMLPKRKKYRKHALSLSWSEAVEQSVGSSQDVRRDKFFNYTECNSYHYVKGCLMAGVDVNLTNQYGQTCLFIAAWLGYTKLVNLLLQFGADPTIPSNGGIRAEHASEANGHTDILEALRRFECKPGLSNFDLLLTKNMKRMQETGLSRPRLNILIDSEATHSGAGACVIDGGFSSHCVDAMIDLWRSLPVDFFNTKEKGPNAMCSDRSYYCDSEGHLRKLLIDVMFRAFEKQVSPPRQVMVFPHMRFLHYAHPGSVLAPHVDLSRTDLSGNSSSHTFILYLYDCESGGETSLLRDLSCDDRNEILAKVSPRRGRLLLFPHSCPHEGNEVIDVPKVLIRGEVKLSR
jgi:2OG-Fe(II) oxygenase superfamily